MSSRRRVAHARRARPAARPVTSDDEQGHGIAMLPSKYALPCLAIPSESARRVLSSSAKQRRNTPIVEASVGAQADPLLQAASREPSRLLRLPIAANSMHELL
ncbi:hypothetical protein ACCO45_007340 [Purpureocillium lilacinum]|uniref:Uncharacterized protein n=1 Tax=Purpureocillium lilacinum TaxID=33203 RepID=A0ACC4DT25_PURLI